VQDSSPVPQAKLLIAAEERRRQGDAGKGRPSSPDGERAEATAQKAWTPEEDELVLELVEEIGTKWSEIVEYLPGRTNNGVKNHFYSSMRKQLRLQRRAEAEAATAGVRARVRVRVRVRVIGFRLANPNPNPNPNLHRGHERAVDGVHRDVAEVGEEE
jgi:hypothetical protein